MTLNLNKSVLMAFVAITLASMTAGAYIVPGGDRPGPYPGRPERPGYPPNYPPNYGRQEQKIIYLGRQVANENLPLRQLAGIGEEYRGYTVESVVIDVRQSGPRAEVSLVTDGRLEETAYSPRGRVTLRPRFGAVLGQDFRSLQLEVRGYTNIDSITINLTQGGGYDRPDRPGRSVEVPLYLNRRMYGNDRLDLTQYIDVNYYRGQRIESIEIEANPVFNTALLDLLINGFNQGQSLQFDRYNNRQVVYPQNAVIGMGADSIVLYSRGDMDIYRVTLRLSRR